MARILPAFLCLVCVQSLNQQGSLERLQEGIGTDSASDAWPVGPQTGSLPCAVNTGKYPGSGWHKEGQTVGRRCLYQSEQEWVEVHSRQGRAGAAPQQLLWINKPDRVHVMAHICSKDRFLLLKRSGYSLEGPSYEVASGHVGHKEKPAAAARRVAQEVMQMPRSACRQPQLLGRHRADAEHGLGWIFSFVIECHVPPDAARRRLEVAAGGSRLPQLAQLTRPQLRRAITGGEFAEAMWSNSAAMALLRAQELRTASKIHANITAKEAEEQDRHEAIEVGSQTAGSAGESVSQAVDGAEELGTASKITANITAKEAEEQDRHEAIDVGSQTASSAGTSGSQAVDVAEEQAMQNMFDDKGAAGGSSNQSSADDEESAMRNLFGDHQQAAEPVNRDAPGVDQPGALSGNESTAVATGGQAPKKVDDIFEGIQGKETHEEEDVVDGIQGAAAHVDEAEKGAAWPAQAPGSFCAAAMALTAWAAQ